MSTGSVGVALISRCWSSTLCVYTLIACCSVGNKIITARSTDVACGVRSVALVLFLRAFAGDARITGRSIWYKVITARSTDIANSRRGGVALVSTRY